MQTLIENQIPYEAIQVTIPITSHFECIVSGERRIHVPKNQFLIKPGQKVRVFVVVIEDNSHDTKTDSKASTITK